MREVLAALLLAVSGLSWAGSSIVVNHTERTVEYEKNMNEVRSIASLTKLMTALIIIESNLDLEEKVRYRGNHWFSKNVSRKDLLDILLIRSDNNAAESLAASWPGGREAFIWAMNRRASELYMLNTVFADASGIDNRNVSTVIDLTKLTLEVGKHRLLSNISTTKTLLVERKNKKKIEQVEVGNTNQKLLFDFDEIVVSKTGTTTAAGRCLALLVERNGKLYSIIILGEPTRKSREDKARHLIFNYAIMNE
jgi:D-alanyl-D-alanine endopeptidase (penicillin-binding protein 7)